MGHISFYFELDFGFSGEEEYKLATSIYLPLLLLSQTTLALLQRFYKRTPESQKQAIANKDEKTVGEEI